ncbi:MAG TPA: histidine phosphatase family protein [Nevskiaceae bacterium]|nr:histidine phosphatase family protein [Nevskiaceae bacterium]
MAVDLFIARHGQNVDNANGILNGHRDLPLTNVGRKQARQLAKGIAAKDCSLMLCTARPCREPTKQPKHNL